MISPKRCDIQQCSLPHYNILLEACTSSFGRLWLTSECLSLEDGQTVSNQRITALLAPSTYIRAYDNSKKLLPGAIHLPINVSPIKWNMEFQIPNILAIFNLLLGRPWLHDQQVVPSNKRQSNDC